MKRYCFGIDVGGTTIKCGLFQTDGKLLEKWEVKTRTENSGEKILPDIADTVEKKLQEKEISKEEVIGIGVGVPGPVNSQGDVIQAVNLFWGYKKVSEELEALTGIPAMAGNDANVAALGEAWKGAAAGEDNGNSGNRSWRRNYCERPYSVRYARRGRRDWAYECES